MSSSAVARRSRSDERSLQLFCGTPAPDGEPRDRGPDRSTAPRAASPAVPDPPALRKVLLRELAGPRPGPRGLPPPAPDLRTPHGWEAHRTPVPKDPHARGRAAREPPDEGGQVHREEVEGLAHRPSRVQ